MANSKISALTSATTPLAGTETLPIVQSSATKQVSVANLTAGRTQTSNGIVQGTAATGYNFTANTPASGMTSQLLNWYEEGTCTFGITFGGGSTGITYNSGYNTGTYTKIGRQVTVTGIVFLSNKGSSTGNAVITGLPFPTISSNGGFAAASLALENITSTGVIAGRTNTSNSTIELTQLNVAGTFTYVTDVNFSNSTQIRFTLVYTSA